MLIIRREQMSALGRPVLRDFEARLTAHLRSGFPEDTAALSDENIRAVIRLGLMKADQYGIRALGDAARLVEYMVCYGVNFDHAPGFSWAVEILNSPDLDGTAKMSRLDAEDFFRLREKDDAARED